MAVDELMRIKDAKVLGLSGTVVRLVAGEREKCSGSDITVRWLASMLLRTFLLAASLLFPLTTASMPEQTVMSGGSSAAITSSSRSPSLFDLLTVQSRLSIFHSYVPKKAMFFFWLY